MSCLAVKRALMLKSWLTLHQLTSPWRCPHAASKHCPLLYGDSHISPICHPCFSTSFIPDCRALHTALELVYLFALLLNFVTLSHHHSFDLHTNVLDPSTKVYGCVCKSHICTVLLHHICDSRLRQYMHFFQRQSWQSRFPAIRSSPSSSALRRALATPALSSIFLSRSEKCNFSRMQVVDCWELMIKSFG